MNEENNAGTEEAGSVTSPECSLHRLVRPVLVLPLRLLKWAFLKRTDAEWRLRNGEMIYEKEGYELRIARFIPRLPKV